MKEFQQRVTNELSELKNKTDMLNDFVGYNPEFLKIDKDEQERLRLQLDIMWQYVEILRERIAAFR